jgi:glycosyltransferase involved in cell wall biosynthesis
MEKGCKILMLVENLPVPGDERVWSEAKTLRDTGFQVSVICPKGTSYFRESHICLENIDIYRYQLPQTAHTYTAYFTEYAVAVLMTFFLSLKVWFRHGIDVIHACNPPDLFFVIGLFYHCFGKKFVFDQHDPAPEMFRAMFKGRMELLRRVLLFLEWCTYRTADVVITTNLSHKSIATGRGHKDAHKVFVVRNGPDLKRMHPVPPEPQLKGARHYMLAYVGVMGILDGVDYALRALEILVHKYGREDISLVLMGDGDDAGRLRALVNELKLDEYVDFVGWTVREDLLRYLSVADIGLSPEPENGLNELCTMHKVLDCMAMGLPIVAFDLAETRFSAQGAALYATPNDVEDFANKVGALLDNEGLRARMGMIGRKRIEEELCWVHSQRDLLRAYRTVFPGIILSLIPASSKRA